jgi:hypothetical protein
MSIFIYLNARLIGAGHTDSRHFAWCGDSEKWEMTSFDDGPDGFHYHSDHSVTCTKCSYEGTRKRAWPTKDKWGFLGLGSTRDEAKAKAINCGHED